MFGRDLLLKTDTAPQSRRILQTLYGGGGGRRASSCPLPPHHENVFEITRLCEAHSDTPLPLQVPPTNRSFHGFFRVSFV